jgi:hypothetical protein
MTETDIATNELETVRPELSEFRRVLRVMFGRWVVTLGVVIIIIISSHFRPPAGTLQT